VLQGHSDIVWALAFSPNGNILASGSGDSTVKVWDSFTGQCLMTFLCNHGSVLSITFSHNGQMIICGNTDGSLQVWDIHTRQCIHEVIKGHVYGVKSIAKSTRENILASSSYDSTIKTWVLPQLEYLHTLSPPRPYEGLDITGATGLTDAQRETLKQLGAIDEQDT
jgi:WD40 repeat protein